MTRRSRRDFDALSEAQLAAGRLDARRVRSDAANRLAAPKTLAELFETIDHVAEAATGERSFLHFKAQEERSADSKRSA
ncbi:hypothetical protein [Methylobacterium sp. sgz302541]|uniref:hypothetical protein n=1 Tax=unclassified Methylobacterium TaxID=2615210 RepID=UPI003D32936B